jgi:hypothetical protein
MMHIWMNVACILVAAGAVTYFSLLHCTTWFEE